MSCQSASGTPPSIESATAGDTESISAPKTLIACPGTPNCVGSLESGKSSVPALQLAGNVESAQEILEKAIIDDGGVIELSASGYIWATYTSSLFRFKDDLELLVNADASDQQSTEFNVRSASRVGKSDFGVNRKRVNRLIGRLAKTQ